MLAIRAHHLCLISHSTYGVAGAIRITILVLDIDLGVAIRMRTYTLRIIWACRAIRAHNYTSSPTDMTRCISHMSIPLSRSYVALLTHGAKPYPISGWATFATPSRHSTTTSIWILHVYIVVSNIVWTFSKLRLIHMPSNTRRHIIAITTVFHSRTFLYSQWLIAMKADVVALSATHCLYHRHLPCCRIH